MRTYESKKIAKKVDVLTGVFCNCCGKDMKCTKDKKIDLDFIAGAHIVIDYGYGSKHDTDHLEFDMCDGCIDKSIGKFVYPPKKTTNWE